MLGSSLGWIEFTQLALYDAHDCFYDYIVMYSMKFTSILFHHPNLAESYRNQSKRERKKL